MNIAIFSDVFLPQINGIVTSITTLAKALADKNHKVIIICPNYPDLKEEFKYKNIKIIRLKSVPAYFYEGFRLTSPISKSVYKIIKKEKINIIHSETPMPIGLQGVIVSKLLKIPLIGTYHTLVSDPEYLKNVKLNHKIFPKIVEFGEKVFFNKCDLIISPTKEIEEHLIKNKYKSKIITLSNGIDLKDIKNINYKEIRNKYAPNNEFILLYVGRISIEKNLYFLIDMYHDLSKIKKNSLLLIIGSGPELEKLKDYTKKNNLTNKIKFFGGIPHEKLLNEGYYKASDLFVTASKSETQGLTIIEAQASSIPAVGINARGTKNVIKDNYNGFLVTENKKEFINKIIKIMNNKKLYSKFKKNSYKSALKEDINNIVKTYEKECLELIKK